MGCDIHLYFEMKNKSGEWKEIIFNKKLLPDDRNYILFSFLADVRNFYERGEQITPQFANRGIPCDTSMPKEDDKFFIGDHSFTHAYLDELLEAPWDECKIETYDLSKCYFRIFCEYILPRLCSWCGSLSKEEQRNMRVIIGFDN